MLILTKQSSEAISKKVTVENSTYSSEVVYRVPCINQIKRGQLKHKHTSFQFLYFKSNHLLEEFKTTSILRWKIIERFLRALLIPPFGNASNIAAKASLKN